MSALDLHRQTCREPLRQDSLASGARYYDHRGYRIVAVNGTWHVRDRAALLCSYKRLSDALAYVDRLAARERPAREEARP